MRLNVKGTNALLEAGRCPDAQPLTDAVASLPLGAAAWWLGLTA